MGNVARKWTIFAFLLAAAFAGSGTSNPASLHARAVSPRSAHSRTLSVNITPNGSVPSNYPCHWTASVSGGSGNYHYAWAVNNSPIGSDYYIVTYTNNGSPFRIDVTVTDGNSGDQGYDSNIMTIASTSCS